MRTWGDALRDALGETTERQAAPALLAARYAGAFSAAYREAFTPQPGDGRHRRDRAARRTSHPRAVRIERRDGDEATPGEPDGVQPMGGRMPLSERVPLLENMGFRVVNERTYRVLPDGAPGTRDGLAARHGAGARRGRRDRRSRACGPRSRRR